MAGRKIQLQDTKKRVVRLNTDATDGAIVGVNLRFQDGRVVQESDLGGASSPENPNDLANTLWRLVLEKPPNIVALAAITTTGIYVITGAGESATRALQQPTAGLTIADADGVAGDPTFALANDLEALEGLAGTGFPVRTADDTWVQRSITGTVDEIDVAAGDGVAGDVVVSLADLADTGVGAALVKITRDAKGRIVGMEAATTDDLAEGLANLYYTDGRADARAVVAVDAHKIEASAHAAENITVTPVGDIVDTDVQAVLAALDARISALEP